MSFVVTVGSLIINVLDKCVETIELITLGRVVIDPSVIEANPAFVELELNVDEVIVSSSDGARVNTELTIESDPVVGVECVSASNSEGF